METLIDKIFELSGDIRYIAIYQDGRLISSERPDLDNSSSRESDKYEELIVNPTLLKLVTQRGNIDCGGAEFVIVRYGNFYELIIPYMDGHLSIGIELNAELMSLVPAIQNLAKLKIDLQKASL